MYASSFIPKIFDCGGVISTFSDSLTKPWNGSHRDTLSPLAKIGFWSDTLLAQGQNLGQ